MRVSISKKEFVFSFIFNGINLILWPYFLYDLIDRVTPLVALTHITYHFNSFYLHICFLSDISLYCLKSKKLEKLNDFMRNKYSPVINPLSYLVFSLYWILYAMGGMREMDSFFYMIKSIYLHLIFTIIIIIDLFSANHNKQHFNKLNLFLCFVYLLLYFTLACISTYVLDFPPYPFLKDIKIIVLAIYCIFFIATLVLCYFFHIFLLYIKYKYIIKAEIDYYNNNLYEDINNKEEEQENRKDSEKQQLEICNSNSVEQEQDK